MEDVAALVLRYLSGELRMDTARVGESTPLVATGLLDSMALVRLAAHLERECDVVIQDHEIRPEHFDTIARIRTFLATKRS